MNPLDRPLRGKLEKTVKEARDIAEAAARAALDRLGVAESAPFAHLSEEERELRRRLRAHGRQLGDALNGGPTQSMDALVEATAYEHWHRMLFARFLAENNLLMYDGVAVTIEECDELAADEGAASGWELAARYAARMLPQSFRPDSPVFQVSLPPEHQQKLERLAAGLPKEVFTASDSLGWVYQFWQAKRKDEVNASEVKIGARELPAVTQLFTEPYMVAFLLDNSLGAWWAAKRLPEAAFQQADSEDELREKAAIPGVPLNYLRFVRKEDGGWSPAAGTFPSWPERLADLKMLDPCCGSGHFLVAALLMLAPMRMELEGLSAREAVDAVLRDNLHGLELDRRCVELAAFALALAAWTYPGAGGYRPLPELNLACCGLSVRAAREEWQQLGLGKKNLGLALGWLHETFRDAPTLGSLLDPAGTDAAKLVQWEELSGALEQALGREPEAEQRELAVAAKGLAEAARLLGLQYHWVVTNVPYLARGKQGETLRDFCEQRYPAAKNDLATVFLERCLNLCEERGAACVVLPQNWLFLSSYKKFREQLLKRHTWHLVARLGPGAFEMISGEVVKAILLIISRDLTPPAPLSMNGEGGEKGVSPSPFMERGPGGEVSGLDVSECRAAADKAEGLLTEEIRRVEQAAQLENPDARITFEEILSGEQLSFYANYNKGICTGDDACFRRSFWEFSKVDDDWIGLQSTVKQTQHYGGISDLVLWENGKGKLHKYVKERLGGSVGAWLRGQNAWNKMGVTIQCMKDLPVELYLGQAFDSNVVTITPKDTRFQTVLWSYMCHPDYKSEVRKLNQKLNVGDDTFIQVPFDLARWQKVAAEQYPHGLPQPYSDDPTQWIFHGHPCGSVIWNEQTKRLEVASNLRTDASVLQVAVARLLGYRWPAELDEGMELAEEQREWVRRCAELDKFADQDGIVCIPPVRGEPAAADRLLDLLAASYGDAWTGDTLPTLLAAADHAGKSLETWLRDKFFARHCKLFQNRPFIWHIWDGLRDGFSALVNYHRLDRKNLETLIYTYLGDWIARQKQDIAAGVDGAQERLAAAETLQKRLDLILKGETPHDIFVRWKPLNKQPIGWEPDLNDGVRLNIRPFLSVPDVKKTGAGVLRDRPNIRWDKDRGKDVASAPWYPVFHGDRINDHHLSLEEKRAAREGGR